MYEYFHPTTMVSGYMIVDQTHDLIKVTTGAPYFIDMDDVVRVEDDMQIGSGRLKGGFLGALGGAGIAGFPGAIAGSILTSHRDEICRHMAIRFVVKEDGGPTCYRDIVFLSSKTKVDSTRFRRAADAHDRCADIINLLLEDR
ncbi:MAG: hypothetical protein WAY93_10030 [Atopobiaceae bacterium]|jgi:outer membrane lipoprotein SlyB|nr:hypothetical protein [Atopobiaceae bacterium]